MTRQFTFCPAVSSPHWQLHDKLNFGQPIALLGWARNPADVDGGPPPDVASLLAQALVQSYRVSFLVADESLPGAVGAAGSTSVWSITSPSTVSVLAARWHGEPKCWNWLSTRDAATAGTLFNQAGFDWTLQAQVVALSPADAPAPMLDLPTTQELWRGGPPHLIHALQAVGVVAVLRPGVDGAFVGAVDLQHGAVRTWLRAVEQRCQELGWKILECPEADL
jgi:hypothetical protein